MDELSDTSQILPLSLSSPTKRREKEKGKARKVSSMNKPTILVKKEKPALDYTTIATRRGMGGDNNSLLHPKNRSEKVDLYLDINDTRSKTKSGLSQPQKRDHKHSRSRKKTTTLSTNTLCLNFLPTSIIIKICRLLDGISLKGLFLSAKYFRYLIECDKQLSQILVIPNPSLSPPKPAKQPIMGVYLKIEGKNSLYFSDTFESLVQELLQLFPALIIHCEIEKSCSNWQSSMDPPRINSKPFELQSLNPTTRKYEKIRVIDEIRKMIRIELPYDYVQTTGDYTDLDKEKWYVKGDRVTVEKLLSSKEDYTFCIRPSSVVNSYVLSYKTKSGVFHSLISKWRNWYFSGDMSEDFVVKGLFFSSIGYLVWYWKTQGLGHSWTPLGRLDK